MARILVIDDNPGVRTLLRLQLERAGHQVLEAAEGGEAFRVLRQEQADLVLCDLFMPGKEGLETIRELRRTSVVPILAMTGDGPAYGKGMLEMAQKLGANKTLIKPFDTETLLEALRDLLLAN